VHALSTARDTGRAAELAVASSGVRGGTTEDERRGLNHRNQVMPTHRAVRQPGHIGKPTLEEARCANSNTTSRDASVRTQ